MNYILVKPIKNIYVVGTLIRFYNDKYIDIESDNEIPKLLKRKYQSFIKLLRKSELLFYKNAPIQNRFGMWKQSLYEYVIKLNIGDNCFVLIDNVRYFCKIMEKNGMANQFTVQYGKDEMMVVDYSNIEIFNENIVKYMILSKDYDKYTRGSRFIKHNKLILTYPYYEIVDDANLKRKLKPMKHLDNRYKSRTSNLLFLSKKPKIHIDKANTISEKPPKYLTVDCMCILNENLVENDTIIVEWAGCLMCHIVWYSETKQFCYAKWRGIVNNEHCIGVELLSDIEQGTNGNFDGQQLFDCKPKRGVLIPEDKLMYICLRDGHQPTNHFVINHDVIINLKSADICCLENIRMPSLSIDQQCLIMNPENSKPIITGRFICTSILNNNFNIGILSLESSLNDIDCTINNLPFITEHNRLIFTQNLDIKPDDLGVIISHEYKLTLYNDIHNKQLSNVLSINKTVIFDESDKNLTVLSEGQINNEICYNCKISNDSPVIIPKKYLPPCCLLTNEHRQFERDDDGWIKPESACCYQVLEQFPPITSDIEVNCSLEITCLNSSSRHKTICKWIGVINGLNCVGVEMVCSKSHSYVFCSIKAVQIDQWKSNFGRLLELKEVQHNYQENHVHLLKDNIVNVNKVWRFKTKSDDGFSVKLGDAVKIQVGSDNISGRVKWLGKINGEKCVGIETCFSYPLGNNGVLKGEKLFNCDEKHGLFVLANNLTREYCQPVIQNYVIPEYCIEHTMDRLSKKWMIGDMVKVTYTSKLVGRIKSFHFINNYKCILITRLDIWANGEESYIFDDDKVFKAVFKEGSKKNMHASILDPNLIQTIEPSSLENNYRIGEAVEFPAYANESKLHGTTVKYYSINQLEFVIVRLNDSNNEVTSHLKTVPNFLITLLKLLPDFIYLIVPNKSLYLRNIQQKLVVLEDNIVKLANTPISDEVLIELLDNNIKVDNRHLVKKLIINTNRIFHFLDFVNIYHQLFDIDDFYVDCLKELLNNTRVCDDCNDQLIEFMYQFLQHIKLSIRNNEILRNLYKLSTNINAVLVKDGELLLTRLLKQIEIPSESIKELLEFSKTIENDHDSKFEINSLNNQNENVLMVICKYRQDGNLFQYVLLNGGDISTYNYKILDILREMENEHNFSSSHKPENKEILRIYSLLNQQIKDHINESAMSHKNDSSLGQLELIGSNLLDNTDGGLNLCRICFERNLQVVYQCGHMSCQVCARQMRLCPFCRVEIGDVKPVFFN